MIRNHAELPPLATPLFEFPVNTAATNYTAVMANAQHIYERISTPGNPMPPPPFPMLTAAQIQRFQDWMNDGCQP